MGSGDQSRRHTGRHVEGGPGLRVDVDFGALLGDDDAGAVGECHGDVGVAEVDAEDVS